MGQVFVKNERTIPASPEAVYTVLADYREKRPLILTPNFLDYKVESGGQGSGTIVSYRFRAANRERAYRMRVDEVVRGKELMERDRNSSLVTTWTVSPKDDGRQTHVQVTTQWEGGSGVMLESLVMPAEKQNGAVVLRKSDDGLASTIVMVGAAAAASAYGLYLISKRKRE
jgi:uncharacterized protein YndB with AHSA1/START domain